MRIGRRTLTLGGILTAIGLRKPATAAQLKASSKLRSGMSTIQIGRHTYTFDDRKGRIEVGDDPRFVHWRDQVTGMKDGRMTPLDGYVWGSWSKTITPIGEFLANRSGGILGDKQRQVLSGDRLRPTYDPDGTPTPASLSPDARDPNQPVLDAKLAADYERERARLKNLGIDPDKAID